jgi:S1-C subfamily serine protease
MGGDGMRIEGTTAGGLAQRAGLQEGDVIAEIAGVPVRSVQGYMGAMSARRPGQAFELVVIRGGKRVPLKVMP